MSAEDALFEYTDDRIIDRGRDYFLSGRVLSLRRSDVNMFEATVQGSDLYTVEVGFDTDEFTLFHWDCDCPYDGDLCKHVAAVVFKICEDPDAITSEVSPPQIASVSYKESVEEVLNNIPLNKLKSFVLSMAEEDRQFAKKFILLFPDYLSILPKNYFNDKIHDIINSYSGGYTHLDPKSTSSALKEIKKMFESVEKQSRKSGNKNLIVCSASVISTLTETAYRLRDNRNEAKSLLIAAEFALRDSVRNAAKDEQTRLELLNTMLDLISADTHPERESYGTMIGLIVRLINSESEVNQLINAVTNKIIPMKYKEEQLRILLTLIEKFKTPTDVVQFLAKHWEYPALREDRINSAFKAKNYKLAVLLAEEGINATAKSNSKLIATWYGLLLKTAIRQKEDDKILNLAVQTISHAGLVYKTDFYAMIKKYIDGHKWIQFVESLINALQTKPENFHYVADIYIRENWGQRLLGHLMLKPELCEIVKYDDFLAKEFREELSLLYAGAMTIQLQEAKNRGQYRDILSYFKKVKKFGGIQTAIDLREELYQRFNKRSILLQELNKLNL